MPGWNYSLGRKDRERLDAWFMRRWKQMREKALNGVYKMVKRKKRKENQCLLVSMDATRYCVMHSMDLPVYGAVQPGMAWAGS